MKHRRIIFIVVAIVSTIVLSSCSNYRGDEFDTNVYEIEFEGHTCLHFDGCGVVHDRIVIVKPINNYNYEASSIERCA